MYSKHGDGRKVVEIVEEGAGRALESGEVRVAMLAAPINPADINMVEGVYGKLARLPAVGGNEGVGRVVEVGPQVTTLEEGDWVLPGLANMGTWRSVLEAREENLLRIRNDLPVEQAATMAVNPCTALRMLRDFVPVRDGDVVVQNAANSAVGMAVIQIAASMGVRTVNCMRYPGEEKAEEVRAKLHARGADVVHFEGHDDWKALKEQVRAMGDVQLAFNAVGGKSASDVVRLLSQGGTVVTYGGMSKKPLSLATGSLIFDDLQAKGYWMTRWNETHSREEREAMLREVTGLIADGDLVTETRSWALQNVQEAIGLAYEGRRGYKVVLRMDGED